jgi:hypothetical protein
MAPEDNRDGTTVYATLATWDMLRLGTIAGLSQRPDARLHRAFVVSAPSRCSLLYTFRTVPVRAQELTAPL